MGGAKLGAERVRKPSRCYVAAITTLMAFPYKPREAMENYWFHKTARHGVVGPGELVIFCRLGGKNCGHCVSNAAIECLWMYLPNLPSTI
jgi:hypothetical protein